ncbi:ABC transporter substrate-binding protein [Streptomyces sparsus]
MRGKQTGLALRIGVLCAVLVLAAAGGWRLLSGGSDEQRAIVVGTTGEVSSLDPAGAYDAASWALYSNVYQSLLTFPPGSATPVPDAAERCSFVGSGLLTYRCTLREGLEFSNGRPMTVEDVRFSFERILGIGHEQGPSPLFDALREVRTEGRTVEFRLKTPDATFPLKIAGGAAAIVDSDQYDENEIRTEERVDGSGPFVLAEYRKGRLARLLPNPGYQGAQDRPRQPVTIRWFTTSEELAEAWSKGEVHVNNGQMPPSALAELDASDPEVDVSEQAGADIRMTVFNTREGSATAPRAVRQALAALVDRQRLSRQVHQNTVEPLYSLIPQGMTGHGTPFFDLHQEPDRAAAVALLAQAGIETPVRFQLAYSRGSVTDAEARELKRQWEQSGLFEVETRKYEWADFLKGFAAGEFDAYCLGWVPDFPDPDTYTAALVGSDNSLHNGYRSKRVDSLIAATQRSRSRSRMMEEFRTIHLEVARDVPILPLWQKKDYVLSDPEVAGTQYLSDNSGMWRLWKLEWL